VPFFRGYSSGDLAERAMSLNQIRLVISNTVVNAVLGNAFAGFNLILLFYYDAKLAAAAVATLAVALGFTLLTGVLQLGDERQVAAVQGKLAGMVFAIPHRYHEAARGRRGTAGVLGLGRPVRAPKRTWRFRRATPHEPPACV